MSGNEEGRDAIYLNMSANDEVREMRIKLNMSANDEVRER